MSKREGIYTHIWLINFIVQQKPTRQCKATIPHPTPTPCKEKAELGPILQLLGIMLCGPTSRTCSHYFLTPVTVTYDSDDVDS